MNTPKLSILALVLCAGAVQTMNAETVSIKLKQEDPLDKYSYAFGTVDDDTQMMAKDLKYKDVTKNMTLKYDDQKFIYLWVKPKRSQDLNDFKVLSLKTSGITQKAKNKWYIVIKQNGDLLPQQPS